MSKCENMRMSTQGRVTGTFQYSFWFANGFDWSNYCFLIKTSMHMHHFLYIYYIFLYIFSVSIEGL